MASIVYKYAEKYSLSWGPRRKRNEYDEYIVILLPHVWTCASEMCNYKVLRSLFGCRTQVKFVRECGRN